MTEEERETLRRAAELLTDEAEILKRGNTLDGEWEPEELEVKATYDEFVRIATELTVMADT